MYNHYKEHNNYIVTAVTSFSNLPVDYTANWKKAEREIGRARGREGVREGRPITLGGRDEVNGRDGGRV